MSKKKSRIPELLTSIETFRNVRGSDLLHLRVATPGANESSVRVRKFKVTVEMIDEPLEVIRARIVDLWETCNNHHHERPLMKAAQEYGFELPLNTCGCRNKNKIPAQDTGRAS